VGFTALYYHWENETEEIEFPLESIYSPYGESEEYTFDVDDEGFHPLLDQALDTQAAATGKVTHKGEDLHVFVSRIDESWEIDEEMHRILLDDFYPDVYYVRGVSISPYAKFRRSQLGITIAAFVIVVIAMIVISVTLFVPIYRFSEGLRLKAYNIRHKTSLKTKVTGMLSGIKKKGSRNSDKGSNKKTVSIEDRANSTERERENSPDARTNEAFSIESTATQQ
jgi:hypothetical protein